MNDFSNEEWFKGDKRTLAEKWQNVASANLLNKSLQYSRLKGLYATRFLLPRRQVTPTQKFEQVDPKPKSKGKKQKVSSINSSKASSKNKKLEIEVTDGKV